jgi:hypothetical protein
MKTDNVLRQEGTRILSDHLGLVESERFIALMIREPFDYTEWQRGLYDGMSLEELCGRADVFWQKTHGAGQN